MLANPVDAGLVGSGSAWPGPWSAPERIGGTALEVSRPKHFFDPNGGMPENATLRLTTPAGFASAEEFRNAVVSALREREDVTPGT